jgi:hypothetical protein
MPPRNPPLPQAAACERARALLGTVVSNGADPRVTVLGLLLRRPGSEVTHMELRAETQPLHGDAFDAALVWLRANGFVESNDLPPYGVTYRVATEVAAAAARFGTRGAIGVAG